GAARAADRAQLLGLLRPLRAPDRGPPHARSPGARGRRSPAARRVLRPAGELSSLRSRLSVRKSALADPAEPFDPARRQRARRIADDASTRPGVLGPRGVSLAAARPGGAGLWRGPDRRALATTAEL